MPIDRRSFVTTLAGAASIAAVGGGSTRALAAPSRGPVPLKPVPIRKALKIGMIGEGTTLVEKFAAARAAGFDGVELDSPGPHGADEVRAAMDATGIVVPGVVDSVHWSKPLSHPDAGVRAEGRRALETAIRDCRAFGGGSVLLVPAVVNAEVSYADAYERSQEEIRRVLPMAREMGVRISIENVWNNFLLSPLEAARYTDELDPRVCGWHFDIGNIVNYGWPTHWIRTLGDRITRLDLKGFSRQKRNDEGLWKGFAVEIGDDDADWTGCVEALLEVGYAGGWAAAEVRGGDAARLAEIARRMDEHLVGPFNDRL